MATRVYSLTEPHSAELTITLKPGMAWMIYTDRGPAGMHGQTLDATCPHSAFAVFETEEAMRQFVAGLQRGRGVNLQYGVIGVPDGGGHGRGAVCTENTDDPGGK